MSDSGVLKAARHTRREVLGGLGVLGLGSPSLPDAGGRLGIPGPFPGRVVEVSHAGALHKDRVLPVAVRHMVTRGMTTLTGDRDEAAAWKRFFAPGDVVGIKVSPVGYPRAYSRPESILAVVRGLNLAGISSRDIVVFSRYRAELVRCEYDRVLPREVRYAYGSADFDPVQTGLDGYDPDEFVEMPRVLPGLDARTPANRRSHLSRVVSRDVSKIVNIAAIKDHATAGLTVALKNMSHGMVNNVARSHANPSMNWCDTFIPTVVGHKLIRRKVVLQIADGIVAAYDGGPGGGDGVHTWPYGAILIATDPLAMDRIAWGIIDRKRASAGLPLLAQPDPKHPFRRQPEHVLLAGRAGLGVANLAAIDHRRCEIAG